MENITEWVSLGFTILGIVVAAASSIVALTPTQKDDAVMAKIVKIFDAFSVFNPRGTVVKKVD